MPRTGVLDRLDDDQRELLLTWIETLPIQTVLEKIANPEPTGFGIQTHITSLRRFYHRQKLALQLEAIETAQRDQMSKVDCETLIAASSAAMTHNIFEIVTAPALRPAAVSAAARYLLKMQEIQLRREQLQLARERQQLAEKKLLVYTSFKSNEQGSVDLRAAGKVLDDLVKIHNRGGLKATP